MTAVATRPDGVEVILAEMRQLRGVVLELCRQQGTHLSSAQVCQRLGISRGTLRAYIARGNFPPPGKNGKWLLADVVEAEAVRMGQR
jgi:predicted DNA-binding transcriptional regulator AlpA